jgi:hypothetical protein
MSDRDELQGLSTGRHWYKKLADKDPDAITYKSGQRSPEGCRRPILPAKLV